MSAVTTAAAASQAGVTVATIRAWCRIGAVAAIKKAGRWTIDTASLAYRITLGTRLARKAKPVTLTPENLVAIGGNRWQKNGNDRIYFNDWTQFAGLDVNYYKSGSVNGASLGGRAIANGRVGKLLGSVDKIWFDAADGQLHARHYGADAFEVRFLDGTRETIDLLARIFAAIKTAAATAR